MTVHIAAADNDFGGDENRVAFSHSVSWVGSGIEMCQFMSYFNKS